MEKYTEFSEPGSGRYGHTVSVENLHTIPAITAAMEDWFNQWFGDNSDVQQQQEAPGNTELAEALTTFNSFLQIRLVVPLEAAHSPETVPTYNERAKVQAVNILRQLAYMYLSARSLGPEDVEPNDEGETYTAPENIAFNANNQFSSVISYSHSMYAEFKPGASWKVAHDGSDYIHCPELRLGFKLRNNATDTRGAYNYG